MVTTLTLNLIATHIDQTIVVANLALATTLLNPHLGKQNTIQALIF